jgi:hypothetical protein
MSKVIDVWNVETFDAELRGDLEAFGRLRGCCPDKKMFDLYSHQPLRAEAVIAIHTEGEPRYAAVGRDYPLTYATAARMPRS